MSGTVTVGVQFASAVTATGAQLDANFSTICAYINDPTNRNNYAQDAAATNTVVLTFSPPVVGGYTAGLGLTWKWGVTNSGAAVINANGLGNINLVNPDGSALQAGQGLVGSIGQAVSDGTRAIYLVPPSPATKAQMQTATASATFITPAQAINHPGVSKAWTYFNGTNTGTITALAGFNISSIVRTGTGTYSITFANSFASSNYVAVGMGHYAVVIDVLLGTKTTSGITITSTAIGGTAADCHDMNLILFGTT